MDDGLTIERDGETWVVRNAAGRKLGRTTTKAGALLLRRTIRDDADTAHAEALAAAQ